LPFTSITEILVMGFGLSVKSRRKFNFLKKKIAYPVIRLRVRDGSVTKAKKENGRTDIIKFD